MRRDSSIQKAGVSRRAFIAAAGATGSVALAGCAGTGSGGDSNTDGGNGGGGSEGNSQDGGTKGSASSSGTLEAALFVGQFTEEDKEYTRQYISEFEESSGWTVKANEVSQAGQLIQQARSRFEAGDPYDVLMAPGLAIANFADNNYLADLTGFLDDSSLTKDQFAGARIFNAALNGLGPFNGETQGLPLMSGSWGALYYNADVLEEAGYDPMTPDDYLVSTEDMFEVANTVKENVGIRPLGFSGADHLQTVLQFYGLYFSQSGRKSCIKDGEPQFATEDGIGTAEIYERMSQNDLMPRGALSKNATDMRASFMNGETAMYTVGSFEAGILEDKSDVNFGITYTPHPSNGVGSAFGGGTSWVVGRDIDSQHKEKAWEFLEHITTPEKQANMLGLIPSLKEGAEIYFEGFTDGIGREVGNVFIDQLDVSGFPSLSPKVGAMNSAGIEEIQQIIAGNKGAEEAMEALDQKVRDAF